MKRLLALALGASAILAASGCTPSYVTQDASDVIMNVVGFTSSPLTSDVANNTTGTLADNDGVLLEVVYKDQNTLTSPSSPNQVLLDRYTISYVRSDGQNVQGVDVPYNISGTLTGVIDVAKQNSSATPTQVTIQVVTLQAKLEPPLSDMRGGGGDIVLTVQANVTIYAHTISGVAISASGSLPISFADYKDS